MPNDSMDTDPLAQRPEHAPHASEVADILRQFNSNVEAGLSDHEARSRLRKFGPNRLRARKPRALMQILRNQFESPVVLLLAAAALVALVFGEWAESTAIAAVLLVNSVIGFVTELRAVRSMESLRRLGSVVTRVRRNGQTRDVAAEQVVPGDIVIMEGGDVITSDMRLIEASNLFADESALTGEAMAVEKQHGVVGADVPIGDRASMVFKGTSLTRGSGLGIVVATGMQSELGKISKLVEEAKPEHSPLEKQLDHLSGHLIRFTLVIAILIGALGIYAGNDLLLMIEAAIALAVAAIPEGLPIVATMALARGMWRMAKKNALIERLSAVETLGATTVILTDKTGTLTENRMTVREIVLAQGPTSVSVGTNGFEVDGQSTTAEAVGDLEHALTAIVLCNSAELDETGEAGIGDPMELALLRAAKVAGLEQAALEARYPSVREVAFDSQTKMMASVRRSTGTFEVFVKGAPEAVLEHATQVASCGALSELSESGRRDWLSRTDALAAGGMRVLAVATKPADSAETSVYDELVFTGLIGLHDPPRGDAASAVAQCHQAGIRVVMVTGDHATTARSIAGAIGLAGPDALVVEGASLKPPASMSEEERRIVLRADVFARLDPAQKLDLVGMYQAEGEIVAMTGDGVNDAPALKKADIGVAMGLRGTQVAREAAAMVLRDDAFATIVAAIREGRVIFRNIQVFVAYLLSCNLSEILVVGSAIGLGLPLPLLPLQILFLNLVTDVFPAFALGMGEGPTGILRRHPRDPAKPIIVRELWAEIVAHGLLITLATLGALIIARQELGLEGEAAVTVSFLTLALAQLWHVFNMRDYRSSPFSNSVTRNPLVWAALLLCGILIVAVVYIPAMAALLHLRPPGRDAWLLIIAMSVLPLIAGQIGKAIVLIANRQSAYDGA